MALYEVYFDHHSWAEDDFYKLDIEQAKDDTLDCLDFANSMWEVLVNIGEIPEDSFLYEVRLDGNVVWSITNFD